MAQFAAADAGRPAREGGAGQLLDLHCINWLRQLPYVRAWAGKYAEQGLVVIGVHTPEFPFEHEADNARAGTSGRATIHSRGR
jgi:hypothetical protein